MAKNTTCLDSQQLTHSHWKWSDVVNLRKMLQPLLSIGPNWTSFPKWKLKPPSPLHINHFAYCYVTSCDSSTSCKDVLYIPSMLQKSCTTVSSYTNCHANSGINDPAQVVRQISSVTPRASWCNKACQAPASYPRCCLILESHEWTGLHAMQKKFRTLDYDFTTKPFEYQTNYHFNSLHNQVIHVILSAEIKHLGWNHGESKYDKYISHITYPFFDDVLWYLMRPTCH